MTTFTEVAVCQPELPEGSCEACGYFSFSCGEQPAQCRPQVVVLGFQTCEPDRLLHAPQFRLSFLCQAEAPFPVPSAHPLDLASCKQLLVGIMSDGFQQAIAHLPVLLFGNHQ